MSILNNENAQWLPLVIMKLKGNFYALLVLVFTFSTNLSGCKKVDIVTGDSGKLQLKEWFSKTGGTFAGSIAFKNDSETVVGNSKVKADLSNVGKWDFSQSKSGRSKNLKWIEVPLVFAQGQKVLVQNFSLGSNGLEADFTRTYLIVYSDSKKVDTNYIVRIVSARLPVESQRKKRVLANSKIREVYYSSKGAILADYDIVRSKRHRFITSLPNTDGRRPVDKKALVCKVTKTSYPDCTVDANYNSVCTFYSVSLTRCEVNAVADPSSNLTNNAYLEEAMSSGAAITYEFEEVELQNQQLVDSLQGFSCAQGILAELPSCNTLITDLMNKIFSPQTDEMDTLRFKVDTRLTKDSLLSGYFLQDATLNKYWYKGTIYLNPWELNNSTKEFIVATMIHEVMHSIIGYDFTRAYQGIIDTNTFKARYPIFWNYGSTRNLNNTEIAEHQEFAGRYRSEFKNVLKQFNYELSDEMAEALAWNGLHKTTAWKMLSPSDTVAILEKIHIARQDYNPNQYTQFGLTKCK